MHLYTEAAETMFLITQTGSEVMKLQPNTSEQSAVKILKMPTLGPYLSPSSPSRTHVLPVLPLGKLPARTSSQGQSERLMCLTAVKM